MTGCGFPATGGRRRLCDGHTTRFTTSPFDDPDVFALTENGPRRRVRYDAPLNGVARLEMQFVLQQRHDERGASLGTKHFAATTATGAHRRQPAPSDPGGGAEGRLAAVYGAWRASRA